MKKTGIVSCYFIHNYGSMLQAYATQKVLDKLEVNNETINVSGFIGQFRKAQYTYILKSGLTSDIFKDRLGKAKNLLVKKFLKNDYTRNIRKRDVKFDEFASTVIRKSEAYGSLAELAEKCEKNYDTVLIGSDQLWLPANIAADYYTLNFVPESVNSIAYATSFGVSSLPKDAAQMAKQFLPRIKHISVREQAGQKLIQDLTGRKVPVVCDPTLLFTGEEWTDIQNEEPIVKEPYIFCYFIGSTELHRQFVTRLKEKTGLKIVALTHVDHFMKSDEGYKNPQVRTILPILCISLIRSYRNKGKLSINAILLCIASALTMVLNGSSTGLVGIAVFLILLFLFHKKYKALPRAFTLINMLIGTVTSFIGIIVFRVQELFAFFIVGVLGKDLDFTNRAGIWSAAIEAIGKHWFLGYGHIEDAEYISLLRYRAATHPHNYFLYVCMNGGIVLVIVCFYGFFRASKSLNENIKNVYSKIILFTISAFLLMGLTESLVSTVLLYPMLVMAMKAHVFSGMEYENKPLTLFGKKLILGNKRGV